MLNPFKLLGKTLSKGSVVGMLGGAVVRAVMNGKRRKYKTMEPLVERLNAYDIGRGAGRLIQGWLLLKYPAFDIERYARFLNGVIEDADGADDSIIDRARNRFLVSKALFYLEGFKLTGCRYESVQLDARRLLRRHPSWRDISRRDVFLGIPFAPETLIGATHRLLVLTLDGNADAKALRHYLQAVSEDAVPRDEIDYMQRLIARTFGVTDEEEFLSVVRQWFEEYREFAITRTHKQEAVVSTSLAAATGGLPAMAGMGVLQGVGRVFRRKPRA